MLSEEDLRKLDRLDFDRVILEEVQRILSQAVDLSTIVNARDAARSRLKEMDRLLQSATPEVRPRLEHEIKANETALNTYNAEIAAREAEVTKQQANVTTVSHQGVSPPPREVLRKHRLQILRNARRREKLRDMVDLGRRVGASKTALYGMTWGDSSRYSEEKLEAVLKKIGCSREHWDNPNSPQA